MSYQDSYLQDKKRKLSQGLVDENMKDKLSYLTEEQKQDVDAMMEDDESYDEDEEEEMKPMTMDDLERKNRALVVIEEYLQNENGELRKTLKEIQKENEALKNVLKNDFKVNYKSGV